jgi:chromosome segregation ATPase
VVTWAHTQRKSQRRTSANANQDLDWNPRILGAYEEHEQEGRHAGDGNHKRAADGGQTETAMREQLLSLRERERESRHDAETLREELLSAHLTLAQLQPQLQACVVQLQQLQTGGGADPDARCVTGQMRAQKDSEDTKQHSFQQKMSQQLTDLRETKGREMAALHAQMEAVLEHLECIEEEAVRAGYEQDARLEQAEVLKRELEACKATLAVVRLSSKEIRDLRAEEALEYEKKLSELGDEYQAAMRQHEERHKLAEAELCQMHAAVQLITEDMRSLSRRVEVPREGGEIGGGKLIYSSPLSHQNKVQ